MPSPFSHERAFILETMPQWVYIIQSQTSNRYYCGQSSNVKQRLAQHNDPDYRLSKTTKNFAGPWKIIWTKECLDRSEATRLERRIKRRGILRFLESKWGR